MNRSLYDHGYVRVAAALPTVRIDDPAANGSRSLELARQGEAAGAALVVFPELGLSGYSIDDHFHQDALLDGVEAALADIRQASESLDSVLVLGAPLRAEQGVFNCGVVVHRGQFLGVVAKSYLPEYREFYEKRQFRAARDRIGETITLCGRRVPFGADLLFDASDKPDFVLAVEICEDLWVPVPPSTWSALAGATVLANLSASNSTIGKSDYRRALCSSQSARTLSAYIYAPAGQGESTTDLAWDGQAMICENGELLAEAERYRATPQLVCADVDLDRLRADRAATSSWGDSIHDYRHRLSRMRRIEFELGARWRPAKQDAATVEQLRGPAANVATETLDREIPRFPYVPSDARSRSQRCAEVYSIQVAGLETRMRATGLEKIVIGVSGGLDSTHALLVAVRALDRIGLPRTNLLAYTMPGFGTSERTLSSARRLMVALGVSGAELDIRPAAQRMLESIEHPAAGGEPHYDVTYENVQAGERTSHLFRLANLHGGLVLGTGDLSELALGWSTYGVGDQMSHYAVNASVPKTLIQFLLRWAIDTDQFGSEAGAVLQDVIDTEISPELIPGGEDGEQPAQRSEQTVGPYELADFFLYHVLRFGNRPSKVAWLASQAWSDRDRGRWPDLIPEQARNQYTPAEIERWLKVFLDRFFRTSQFKRSAIPNGPKVGSGGSLSPRGDWRAPSDGNSDVWLGELEMLFRREAKGDVDDDR